MLGHDGRPLRGYRKAKRTAQEYRRLSTSTAGTIVEARVAMFYDLCQRNPYAKCGEVPETALMRITGVAPAPETM